ncbi:MAG: T9SS type A sorting domain-containing protein [Bacteroidota bacterium]
MSRLSSALLIFFLALSFVAPPAASGQSGTFDFTGCSTTGNLVNQTVSGVLLTAEFVGGITRCMDLSDAWGTSGNGLWGGNSGTPTSLTLVFDTDIAVTSLRAARSGINDIQYTFIPSLDGVNGTALVTTIPEAGQTLDFTSTSGFEYMDTITVTSTNPADLNNLALDNIVFSAAILPVELSAFDVLADGTDALLRWQTASETGNAGFHVEHQAPSHTAFRSAAFVDGHGTTTQAQRYAHRLRGLEPGIHRFRLRQVDFDGTFEVHPEVELTIEAPTVYRLGAYPNPFNPQTTVSLTLAVAQEVEVGLYDVLGRRVQVLHTGALEGGRVHPFAVSGSELPSGVYVVRAVGASFARAITVQLIK